MIGYTFSTRFEHAGPFLMSKNLVVHLTSMGSSKYGAIEHYLLEVARCCHDRGVKTLLQYESTPLSEEYLSDLKKVGAELVVTPVRSRSMSSPINAMRIIQSARPRVVHTHFVSKSVLLAVAAASRAFGVSKLVHTQHSCHDIAHSSWKGFCFNFCDHVLAVSNAIAEDLRKGKVKTEIVKLHIIWVWQTIL